MQRHRESFAGTQRREQRAGADGDFYGIRPWRSGDSRRWIHGRTSARTGKLMVLQFEQPRNHDVALLAGPVAARRPEAAHRRTSSWPSVSPPPWWPICAARGTATSTWATAARPQCLGGPASAALLQDLMKQLALVEGHSRRRPGRVVRRDLRPHRVGGGVGPGHHPAYRLERPVASGAAGRRPGPPRHAEAIAGGRHLGGGTGPLLSNGVTLTWRHKQDPNRDGDLRRDAGAQRRKK